MIHANWMVLLILIGLLFAGCNKTPKSVTPDTKATKQPAPPGKAVIQKSSQGIEVVSGDRKVWPPKGPGCEKLVGCCSEAAKKESSTTLFCQLALAKSPDCIKALTSVVTYLGERGAQVPASCK